MKEAPIPENEAQRLAALRALKILDTPPEERFDRITRLAMRLFDVPIALISFVDEDRQWFKSCQGLSDTETPRAISFCGHAILDAEALLIPDTHLDERFADNPLVTGDPKVRFYVGQPLTAPDGSRVGVLCLKDRQPRDFGDEELSLLKDLAAMVESEFNLVEVSELQQELTKTNQALRNEIAGREQTEAALREVQAQLEQKVVEGAAEIAEASASLEEEIAERKQVQQALRRGEERFRQVITSISAHVYMTEFTADGEQINHYLSPNVETLTGYPREKFLEDWNFWPSTLIHPEDRAAAAAQVERFSRGQDSEVEYRLIRADGELIWLRDSVRVEKDPTSQSLLVYGVVSDVTGRKRAEEAQAKLAAELETVAQVSIAASTVLEVDKLLQQVVDLTKTSFGLYLVHIYLLDEGGDALNLAAGAGEIGRQLVAEGWSIPLEREQSLVARAARQRQAVMVNDIRQDAKIVPYPQLPYTRAEMAIPMMAGNNLLGILNVQSDVVGRFSEEDIRIQTTLAAQIAVALQNAKLFEQAQRYAAQLESLSLIENSLSQATDEAEILTALTLGIDLDRSSGRATLEYIDPNEAGQPTRAHLAALWQDGQIQADEARLYRRYPLSELPTASLWLELPPQALLISNVQADSGADEAVRRYAAEQGFQAMALLPLHSGGQWQGLVTFTWSEPHRFSSDERFYLQRLIEPVGAVVAGRRAYLAQQETAGFLDSIVENIPTMLFVKDAQELRFVRWNRAGEALIGMSRDELIGKNDYDFFPKEEADFFAAKDRQTLAEGEIVDIPEEPIQTADKGTRLLHTRKVPVYGSDGRPKYLLGISEDITERKQVEETLAKRAAELETAAEVSTAASTILDTAELLQTVVDLTKERFDLYHAHIYLLDEIDGMLNLAAGAGEVGRQMVAEGWRIPLDRKKSLVARAARDRQGVIVNDVHQEPFFFPNPLLPDTCSELAVPLLVGDKILGVLDVQADATGHFTGEDVRIQTTLAAQVASAIRNARLFESVVQAQQEVEDHFHEIQALQQLSQALAGTLQVDEILDNFFAACTQQIGFDYVQFSLVDEAQQRVKAIAGIGLPNSQIERSNRSLDSDDIMVDIINSGQTELITGWDDRFERETFEAEGHADWVRVFTPITLRRENIGLVEAGFHKKKQANIADSQIRLLRAFIDQTALALDGARRYESSQTAARQLALLNEMGAELNQTSHVDEVYKIVASKVNQILGGDRASVALLNPAGDRLEVFALDGRQGSIPVGAEIPLARSLIGRAIRERQVLITADISSSDYTEHRQLAEQGIRSVMTAPLVTASRTIGTLNVGSRESSAFGSSDKGLMRQVVSLLASIIEKVRLFEQTEQAKSLLDKRVRELDCLNKIGRKMVESPPIAEFLPWVTGLIPPAMQYPDICLTAIEFEGDFYGEPEAIKLPRQVVHGLRISGNLLGYIYISYTENHDFLDEESALLGDVARRVTGYIENQRLFEQTQAVLAETRALYEVSRTLTTAVDLEEAVGNILVTLDQQGVAPGADSISLTSVEVDEAGRPKWAELLAWWYDDDREPPYPIGTRFPIQDSSVARFWMADPSKPLLFGDIESDERVDAETRGQYRQAGVQATVLMPLMMAGRWVGLLNINWTDPQAFRARDQRLYRAFMGQFATLVESQRLFDQTEAARAETEAQARRLARLNEMSEQLNLARDEDEVFRVAARQTARIIHCDRASVALLAPAGDSFDVLALEGNEGAIPAGAKLPLVESGISVAVNENRLLNEADVRDKAWVDYRALAEQGICSIMNAPLVVSGQVIGCLNVSSPRLNAYSAGDENLMRQMASLLSSALENRRLFAQTQARAHRERVLREVTDRVRSSADVDTIMRTAAREVGRVLGRPTFVYLGDEGPDPNGDSRPTPAGKEKLHD